MIKKVLYLFIFLSVGIFLYIKQQQNKFQIVLENSSKSFQKFHEVIKNNCNVCHLNYTYYNENDWLKSGLFIPGNPELSELFLRITKKGDKRKMPLIGSLTENEIEIVKKYISSEKISSVEKILDLKTDEIKLIKNEMSENEKFSKCSTLFTGFKNFKTDQIENRQKIESFSKASDKCLELLNLAKFGNNTKLAMEIRNQWHRFHTSWFSKYGYFKNGNTSTYDLYPMDEAALHLTKTLFDNIPYEKVINSNQQLEAKRISKDDNKVQLFYESREELVEYYKYILGDMYGVQKDWSPKWLNRGRMIDIVQKDKFQYVDMHVNRERNLTIFKDKFPIDKSIGGAIGAQSYILANLGRDPGEKSNGGLVIPRRWAKNVLKDFFCRDIPVVNGVDAVKVVQNKSEIIFRRNNHCMQCHVTIDPLAGAIRNVQSVMSSNDEYLSIHLKYHEATKKVSHDFYPDRDSDYYLRPNNGNFYYRDIKGKLHNENFNSFNELKLLLSKQDDYYICAASKYLYYLTGIKVQLRDYSDSYDYLGKDSKFLLQYVNQLGLNLKEHQSIKQLLKEIIDGPVFSSRDIKNSLDLLGK